MPLLESAQPETSGDEDSEMEHDELRPSPAPRPLPGRPRPKRKESDSKNEPLPKRPKHSQPVDPVSGGGNNAAGMRLTLCYPEPASETMPRLVSTYFNAEWEDLGQLIYS